MKKLMFLLATFLVCERIIRQHKLYLYDQQAQRM